MLCGWKRICQQVVNLYAPASEFDSNKGGIDIYLDICLNLIMSQQNVWKALADPTRRAILKSLKKESQTAGALAEQFPMTRASLSHHFNILKAADLVRTERRGQHIVYSLNVSVMEDAAAILMDLLSTKDTTKVERT